MIRDPISHPLRPARSARTAFQTFRLVDIIAQAHEPTQTQLEALSSAYFATGEFLLNRPEFCGELVEIHAHGSRQLGTIVRPRDGSREGFDIDLIARLASSARQRYGGTGGPALLLNRLEGALRFYASAHGLSLQRHSRCVTLEYAGGMCADIAPVIDDPSLIGPYGGTHSLIPDRDLQRMGSTNPRGYAKYFTEIGDIVPVFQREWAVAMDSIQEASIAPLAPPQEVFARILCRIVQLIKLHRNAAFASNDVLKLAPTSIFLTTLAAEAYRVEAGKPHSSPLELLLDVVERMPLHFERTVRQRGYEDWFLADPAVPRGNLAEGMTEDAQATFFQWHRRLIADISEILTVIDGNRGMDILLRAVKSAFGDRAAAAVKTDGLTRLNGLRNAGKTAIFTPATAGAASTTAEPSTGHTVNSRPHTFFGH